jgi:ATP-dependent RNA helicase DeaD
MYRTLIEEYEREQNVPAIDIAAALARMGRGDEPLLLEKPDRDAKPVPEWQDRPARAGRESFGEDRPARPTREAFAQPRESFKKERVVRAPEQGMATYRIEVGHANSVKPGNIVGAIANEGGIPSKEIGRIEIYDDYSTLDLPQDLLDHLQKVWVAGRQLNITRDGDEPIKAAPKKKFFKKKQ